ncbi:MAG: site-specific integrase, partial [Cyanobacteria bacterium REEB65]|nr:site-specific integrase [Cyanobacteria bacterium REEB65]
FPFTKQKLDGIKPPPKGYVEYHDTTPGVRGLVLRVLFTGAKTFSVNRRIDGRPKRTPVGPYPEITIKAAQLAAERINGKVAEGKDPTAKAAAVRAEPTLDGLFKDYMESPRKRGGTRKPRTIEEYERILEAHLKSFRKRKISMLTYAEMSALHVSIAKKNGKYAANRTLALVKAMYNFAITRQRLSVENPAVGIVAYPEQSRERRLWDDEMKRLFAALDTGEDLDIRDFVFLALLTGARKSNVLAMRWEDVLPLERAMWRIPDTKNGLPQIVPLVPEAVEILKGRHKRKTNDHVFPGDGATGHLINPWKKWDAALKGAGLSDLRIHDLRRTLGSYQVDSGTSLEAIGRTLGHKSSASTQVYARMAIDPIRQAIMAGTGAILKAGGRERVVEKTVPATKGKRTKSPKNATKPAKSGI